MKSFLQFLSESKMTKDFPAFKEAVAKYPELKRILDYQTLSIPELLSFLNGMEKLNERLAKVKPKTANTRSHETFVNSFRSFQRDIKSAAPGNFEELSSGLKGRLQLVIDSSRRLFRIEDGRVALAANNAAERNTQKAEPTDSPFQRDKTSFDIQRERRLAGK